MKTPAAKPLALAPLSAVLLSQFVAADAGSVEAKHDARLCAVYGAYRTALKDGNKTQLMLVEAACATYATPKACRALTDVPDRTTPAATRACAVYGAYKLALDACGIPALMKGATLEAVEAEATATAARFVDIITVALTPAPKAVKSEADKAADKAKKKAEVKAAEKAQKALIATEAQKIADANALTLADMHRAMITAILTGALSSDQLEELSDVLDTVAVTIVETRVPVDAPEAVPA